MAATSTASPGGRGPPLGQDVAQRAAVDVLHDDREPFALDDEVADLDDGGVAQAGQDRAFLDEPADEVAVGEVLASQELGRDGVLGALVDRAPDLIGGAFAEPVEQAVRRAQGVVEALRLHDLLLSNPVARDAVKGSGGLGASRRDRRVRAPRNPRKDKLDPGGGAMIPDRGKKGPTSSFVAGRGSVEGRNHVRPRSLLRHRQDGHPADVVDHQRGLTDQISQLDTKGQQLSDPNNWDGPLAERFRSSTWPGTKAALDKAKTELEELRVQLDQISQNIMTAGGGA